MQLFQVCFCQAVCCMVDNIIYTAEVIHGFHNIINTRIFGRYAKRVCFKDKACLLFSQPATLYVVGVICKVYLRTVIYAAFEFGFFLITQALKQR